MQFRALGDKVFKGGKRNATFTMEDGRVKNVSVPRGLITVRAFYHAIF